MHNIFLTAYSILLQSIFPYCLPYLVTQYRPLLLTVSCCTVLYLPYCLPSCCTILSHPSYRILLHSTVSSLLLTYLLHNIAPYLLPYLVAQYCIFLVAYRILLRSIFSCCPSLDVQQDTGGMEPYFTPHGHLYLTPHALSPILHPSLSPLTLAHFVFSLSRTHYFLSEPFFRTSLFLFSFTSIIPP